MMMTTPSLGVHPSVVAKVPRQLMSKFCMANLGSASLGLGMEIDQGPGYITVSQQHYVHSVLDRFGYLDVNPAPSPGVGKLLPLAPEEVTPLEAADVERYQELVGPLIIYLFNTTRWDVRFSVMILSRAMSAPNSDHMIAAERVLRNLRGTADL